MASSEISNPVLRFVYLFACLLMQSHNKLDLIVLLKEITKKDEHKLKLAQLDWELTERQK